MFLNICFFLSENKESYLYYYYTKVARFSSDPPPCSSRENVF